MEARRKSEELRQQLVRKQRLLDNTSLVSALPDKGEKIRQSIGDIQRQITKLKEIADEEDVAPPQTTHHPPSWPINSVHPATSQDAAFLAQQFANLMDMDSKNNDAEATEQRAMDMDLDESVSHEGVMMYGRYFPNELERRRFVKREQLRLGKVGFQQAQWDSKRPVVFLDKEESIRCTDRHRKEMEDILTKQTDGRIAEETPFSFTEDPETGQVALHIKTKKRIKPL